MKTRVLTAIAIILCVFPPLFFGGWLLEALAVFVVCTSSYEFIHVLLENKRWEMICTIIMAAWVLGLNFIPEKFLMAYWICALIFFWSLPVFTKDVNENAGLSMTAFAMILGFCYMSIRILIPNFHYLWTIVFATYGSDTGAYFAGRFFGKHKMNERVSPKKTWEGFFGGWVFGFILSYAMSFLYVSTLDPTINLAICALAPVFAELGDLCFSAFKRAHEVKDFSDLLPGHGGILDRIDSLLMNILLFGIIFTIL
ncbi:phosphatidate cytidylyltransferase [Ileibacterium valens]|uniref:Phosphatidate cytidylyltransferase n=1 Tax=Ileibacterium valens TaxID=1862668 RepID=A0A1U7NIZ4_9FIRM|nr:phosphatidate cytidylyltransferase [Ileibacterium valens]OLU39638.1 phosphatidate cytidylyltransferase [Erysipelotrichaceae bacterium NYU-BL-E8]OLU42915.1 phosphatidate cytidylyltransferase [Ileibacterium valens]OLU42937.1 phosphatidate cytidylyltransferase [Erysipelotrichaceae bacterium NYU-BL-F16]